jgi:hypothetical protein
LTTIENKKNKTLKTCHVHMRILSDCLPVQSHIVLIDCDDVEVPHNKAAFVSSAKSDFHSVPHTLKRTVVASRVNPAAATQVPSLPSLSSVKKI